MCIKLVNYRDKYAEMHGQQNVKKYIYTFIRGACGLSIFVSLIFLSVSFMTATCQCTRGWPCLPNQMFYLAQLKKKNELSHFDARFQVNTVLPKNLLACHTMSMVEWYLTFWKTVEPLFPSSSSPIFVGSLTLNMKVDCFEMWWQKPDFVFRRNGRIRLNRQGRQFSGLLATYTIRQFPLHFPSRVSPCAITFQLDSNVHEQ